MKRWRLIIGEEVANKIKQVLHDNLKMLVKRALQEKLVNTVYQDEALKIVERDSIWLILPKIDDQKLYHFCVVLFTLLPYILQVLNTRIFKSQHLLKNFVTIILCNPALGFFPLWDFMIYSWSSCYLVTGIALGTKRENENW